jgi:hypothetical protein
MRAIRARRIGKIRLSSYFVLTVGDERKRPFDSAKDLVYLVINELGEVSFFY